MNLGIGSWTYPWAVGISGGPNYHQRLTVMDLIRRAADLGVGVVQMADNLSPEEKPINELESIAELARTENITLELGTRGLDSSQIRGMLDLSSLLNCRIVRTLLPSERVSLRTVVEALEQVLPDFEEAGVTLAIENYERYTTEEYATLCRTIDSPFFGICLDTTNSLAAGEGVTEVLSRLKPYVVNLHIKDFSAKRLPTKLGFTVTGAKPGEGLLDIPAILSEVAQENPDLSVVLEQWPLQLERLGDTVSLEAEWAEHGVRYLQSLLAAMPSEVKRKGGAV